MSRVAFGEIGNPGIFVECVLCGSTHIGIFPFFNSHNNPENGHTIILMLNMKKLKHKWLMYMSEALRVRFKSRSVRFKNNVFFPIGVIS